LAWTTSATSRDMCLRSLSVSPHEAQAHCQQAALQTAREYEQAPRAPPPRAEPRCQARCEDKTPWGLYAHHRHGQAARLLQPPRHKNLGDVLDSGKDGGQQAEEVGPGADVRRGGIDEDNGAQQGDDKEGERGGEDDDGFLPRGQIGDVLVWLVGLGLAREEDEEQKHAGSTLAGGAGEMGARVSHEEEAGPLHANLGDAEQGGGARESPNLAAAAHVARALGQRQDVGDAGGARHGAQQHKHGAQAT
jgi:hypothetical protein